MRRILLFIVTLLPFMTVACSDNTDKATPEELALAADTGRRAAENVIALPAGSMARENAILAIRAKETELRMAGFEACADTFAAVAGKIILADI